MAGLTSFENALYKLDQGVVLKAQGSRKVYFLSDVKYFLQFGRNTTLPYFPVKL